MYITSAARLRFDITYYINKLKDVQNRKMHNNSCLMTLPLLMWIELADMCHIFRDKTHLQTRNTSSQWSPHFTSSYAIHTDAFKPVYIAYQFENAINTTIIRYYRTFTTTTMGTADYRPMAQEYSIWNAAIASLQFWTEDLNPVTLGRATECVYMTFFYTFTSQTLCQQSDETLFGCFVIALNAAFNQQLPLVDEGYESGSDTFDLPTPLWKTPHIHHIFSMDHTSFNPVLTTPCSTLQTPPRPVFRCLSFSSADNCIPDSAQVCSDHSDGEDFQMVPLDDEHWTSEETPDKTLLSMNTDYHMDYASTYVLTWTITLFYTWTVWI